MPSVRKTIETLARGVQTDKGAGVMPAGTRVPGTAPVMDTVTALSERVEALAMQIPQRIDRGLEVEAQYPSTANVIVQRGLAYAHGQKLESNVMHILPIPLSTITEPSVWYVMLMPGPEVILSEAPIGGGAILAKIVAPSEDAQRVIDNAEDYEGADPDAYIVSGRDLVLTTGCVFDDETMEELLKALERVDMSALKGELIVDDTAAIKTATESVQMDAEGITTFHRNGEMAAQLNNDGVAVWTADGELVMSARGTDGQLNSKFFTTIDVPAGFCGWFDGTWEDAEALEGWAIRDGRSGTTDVVSDQRGIRSVAADQDAGGVGGSNTHGHSDNFAIDSAGSHTHAGTTDDSGVCCCVQECTAGVNVTRHPHAHTYTTDAGGDHCHDVSGGINTASSWGPYQELIPIMKLVDTGQGTVTNADHGELRGLGDDDHTLYHTDARGDARYYTRTLLDAGQLNSLYFTETEVDTWRAGVTVTEMGYLHGVTSDIQTQFGTYMPLAGGTFTGNVTMQTTRALYFRDTNLLINSPSDGVLALYADTQIDFYTHVAGSAQLAATLAAGNFQMQGAGQVQLRDTAIHLASLDDGHLDLTADTSIDLNADTIFGTATDSLKWSADEYITSGAAGYLDAHFADDDKGMRFYSGANLLLTLHRWSAAAPTYTLIDAPVKFDIKVTGARSIQFGSTYIDVFVDLRPRDNVALMCGSGNDSKIYYDATNLIIDPDVLNAGSKLYVGPTANKDIWFGNARVSGTGKIEFGGAESYIQEAAGPVMSYVTDGYHSFVGATKIGDGGTTDYAAFAADGELTLYGTARVTIELALNNAVFTKGATAPTQIIVGNYNGWEFDIGDDAVIVSEVPTDWAAGTDMVINACWAINEAYATDDAEVRWQLGWSMCPHDNSEGIDAPTHTGTDNSGDIDIPATVYYLTRTTVETIPGASIVASDEIGFTISRVALGDGNDPTAKPILLHLEVEYTKDRLGTPTT